MDKSKGFWLGLALLAVGYWLGYDDGHDKALEVLTTQQSNGGEDEHD